MCGCSCWMYSSKYLAFSIFSLFIFMAVSFIVGNCQSLKVKKGGPRKRKRNTKEKARFVSVTDNVPCIPHNPQASVCPLVNELKAKL